jgi:hypothetical protein
MQCRTDAKQPTASLCKSPQYNTVFISTSCLLHKSVINPVMLHICVQHCIITTVWLRVKNRTVRSSASFPICSWPTQFFNKYHLLVSSNYIRTATSPTICRTLGHSICIHCYLPPANTLGLWCISQPFGNGIIIGTSIVRRYLTS